jgi:hypothetical protein
MGTGGEGVSGERGRGVRVSLVNGDVGWGRMEEFLVKGDGRRGSVSWMGLGEYLRKVMEVGRVSLGWEWKSIFL